MTRRTSLYVGSLLLAGLAVTLVSFTRPVAAPEPPAADRLPLPTGRELTPRGEQTAVGSFPSNLRLTPDGNFVVVSDSGSRQFLSVLSAHDGHVVSQLPFNGASASKKDGLYYGLAFGIPVGGRTPLFVSRGAQGIVSVFSLDAAGKLAKSGIELNGSSNGGSPHFAGVAASGDGARVYAAENTAAGADAHGMLHILDPASGQPVGKVSLPGYPFGVAALTLASAGAPKVYVSSERDGTVSVVDPAASRVVAEIRTGDHPTSLVLDTAQRRLFVCNSGSDTVSVVDTRTDRVTNTILVRPDDARGLAGATPLGLALSPDEMRLYVTLADLNAVGVVDLPAGKLVGFVPVGWYPTAVAVAPSGERLFVANAKGVATRHPNGEPVHPTLRSPGPDGAQYTHNLLEGTVSLLSIPDRDGLRRATAQVLANNHLDPRRRRAEVKEFRNPGIEHVLYILKENRTYDQILGDLPQGNGDPKLAIFGREVTPNLHALAERFVLLDNFYCCAEVSADGWNWSTSGMASEYVQRNAPYGYSGRGRGYDYEGQNNGVAVDLKGLPDVSRAPGGYIWDQVARKGLSYRNYGFFVNQALSDQGVPAAGAAAVRNGATKKALTGHTDESYRQFDMAYADSDAWVRHNAAAPTLIRSFGVHKARSRFEEWKQEWDEYVRNGDLPRFMMLRLPRDHTAGTGVGQNSPRAMVADNDFGVAQVVEAVSSSPYWKKTAIFVIEDDAQNGFDHVDAHRSVCWVLSPFVPKATVDHHFYNTDSVLHTMEALLNVPPMCQFDATAPLLRVFGETPENAEPYRAILPERSIVSEVNGRTAYRAADSARLNFREPDQVPDDELNDIIWHAVRGRNAPKPAIRYGLRLAPEHDEEEAGERGRHRDRD